MTDPVIAARRAHDDVVPMIAPSPRRDTAFPAARANVRALGCTFVAVVPDDHGRWIVTTDADYAPLVSVHPYRVEAEAAARAHAATLGIGELVLHDPDGEEQSLLLETV